MKKVLLLVNTGTPDTPSSVDVRRYLSEFLNDRNVIDYPWLIRKALVNLIIIPSRTAKSTGLYGKLWTNDGSPLRFYLDNLAVKLQQKLEGEYIVRAAMRYGKPSLKAILREIRDDGAAAVTVLPLYPQYASSTTFSVKELVRDEVRTWNEKPEFRFIDQFYDHPSFINLFASGIRSLSPGSFDHVVFSYHSLPLRHIRKVHPLTDPDKCTCENGVPAHGKYCYRAACYETTRLLAGKLGLPDGSYTTAFQSRLKGKWLAPFTDTVLEDLAGRNRKRVLVAAPSFVADCLETSIEISDTYAELFRKAGGKELVLVPGLNDKDEWAEAIIRIVQNAEFSSSIFQSLS